jgi:transcriptional regulator with XRE-family HTH domain
VAAHLNTALRKQIGDRLRELRLQAGITSQEALAHKAGVHRTYVGRLERGESGVTVEALAAILAPLGVSLGEFFRPFQAVMRPKTPRRRAG